MKKKKENVYIYAYDPKIKARVIHVCKGSYAISIVTSHAFKYNPKEKEVKKK
jgi:hypothetical protein